MIDLGRFFRRHRRTVLVLTGCLAVLFIVCAVCLMLVSAKSSATAPQATPAAASEAPQAEPQPDPAAEPTPAAAEDEARIAEVMATVADNCTKDAPQITDPAAWNETGAAIMETLAADPYYQGCNISIDAQEGFPYMLAVNRAASTVTVYTLDAATNRYTVPFMAFVCSGGSDTPLGYYSTPISYDWRLLSGPCYGQYATRIWDAYLFHSVPYYTQHKDDLEYDQFNQLGTPASLGCIRLAVVDVKWIYDNCPIGTPVVIYDDAETPGPMGKPGTIATDPADEALRGWDPTDPDPANPWDDHYLTGTAIRSSDAWQQYNDAQADGRWNASINPTDLQGYSTDSSVEGTRG